jgi:hypothetical protein
MEKVIGLLPQGGGAAQIITACSRLRIDVLKSFAANFLFVGHPQFSADMKKVDCLKEIERLLAIKYKMIVAGSSMEKELKKVVDGDVVDGGVEASDNNSDADTKDTEPDLPDSVDSADSADSTSEDYPEGYASILEITQQPKLVSYMRGRFPGNPINGTLSIPDLQALALKLLGSEKDGKAGLDVVATNPESEPDLMTEDEFEVKEPSPTDEYKDDPTIKDWNDTSGPANINQMREIARLKGALKIVSSEIWSGLVAQFKDADGNPLESAKMMTSAQAELFKEGLSNAIENKISPTEIVFAPF